MDGLYYADFYAKPPLSGAIKQDAIDSKLKNYNKRKKYNWFTGARVS